MDTLLTNATKGIRAMPPKGACATCTEADLKAAIEYMISQSE
jgi:cytochrome c5